MSSRNSHRKPGKIYVPIGIFREALVDIVICFTISCENIFDVLTLDVKLNDQTKNSSIKVGKSVTIKIDALKNK